MSIAHIAPPHRSERKARGSGHLRRAELLAAAQRIFTKEGYEGATIRKIAEEVGVSSTALYMYFEDKSQIMLEICVQALEGQLQAMHLVAAQPREPQAKVRALLNRMLRFGFDQPTAYQLLYCVVPKDVHDRRDAVISPLSHACFGLVLKAVEAAQAAGRLRDDAPARTVSEALISACHGVLCIRISTPKAPWSEPAEVSKVLLDGLFHGFGKA